MDLQEELREMVLGLGGSSSSKATFSALPRTVSSITISIGGLALFLIFGSWILISSPLGSTVIQVYFFRNAPTPTPTTTTNIPIDQSITTPTTTTTTTIPIDQSITTELIQQSPPPEVPSHVDPVGSKVVDSVADDPKLNPVPDIPDINITSTVTAPQEQDSANNSQTSLPSSHVYPNTTMVDSGSCDLYHGKWFYDSSGPLYTNNTCPVLTQMQNCQGNGRPDKDYENWRWKPSGCDLPRFDPKKFLELMRGKTLAFIGDSVARNQMESMICILWQVEVPKNRGNKRIQRWFFRSTNTMIVRIWSSWLVHQSPDAIDFAPPGVVKLHLDQPDDGFMDVLPSFDVVVLSSGHWFAKQSVYVLNNEIVGGQLWWPDKTRQMKVNNIDAFGISVETIMTAIGNHPNFTGITIVRSFSPDHYEGGAWNTGGSCTGKSSPAAELVENGFTNVMHEKQVNGFNEAVKKVVNSYGSKLRLMDITEAFSYRHDGHPGPYRSPDPNKVTKRGPHGEPPPQDCLHWCMPGPVDTWNEIVLEIIRREFEGVDSGSSSSLL